MPWKRGRLAFLAIGRPEGDGCYCQVNALLKDIIKEIAGNFDYVIIDGEAGVEQISRRVMAMVTHLLLVSDASLKGRTIVETIKQVAREKCAINKSGLIFNKMRNQEEIDTVQAKTKLFTCGAILENDMIRNFDREGRSFFELPDNDTIPQLNTAIKALLSSA